MGDAIDEAGSNRIGNGSENNWDRTRQFLKRGHRNGTRCEDDIRSERYQFRGTFANYPEVDSSETMKRGRFFTETENSHREDVVVIGEDVAKALFPTLDDALGKQVLVDGSSFTVIGVFDKIGSVLGQDRDNFMVIPLSAYLRLRGGANGACGFTTRQRERCRRDRRLRGN